MQKLFTCALTFAIALGALAVPTNLPAQDDKSDEKKDDPKPAEAQKQPSKYEQLTAKMKKVEGLWTLHHDDQKLFAELSSGDLGKNYIVLTSIARGISSGMVLGGMSWGFDDDVIWTFRKVGDKIHVVRRNVRFQAKKGTPEASAVELAYSDSVLYALPILTATPKGGSLVDMTNIFMSDDQQIGRAIGRGASFAKDRSTWAAIKAFPKNVELQVAAIYAGSGALDTVSDTRGMQVNVHYSISLLPENSYKPRQADDRVGYFLTVLKDFSNQDDDEQFVRYVNRWDLQKADSEAKLSPPKEPIIFYIEKTVPIRLRPIVRDGITEWNKAFEKIGFADAIQVRQQRDDDNWDPEDVRYNTFRWITAEAGFAMGPSRVNPMTGQILDADIIFDASFLRHWKTEYETFTREDARLLMGGDEYDVPMRNIFADPHGLDARAAERLHGHGHRHAPHAQCSLGRGMQQQLGFAAAAFAARGALKDGEIPEEFVHQALKEVVMHEVGHTLGLRHNFKASTWKPLDDIDGGDGPTVASVMDYNPANIAAKDAKQGAYYTPTIGPYDYWAIEYGYKQVSGKEGEELAKVASRTNEPGHDYATDEDTRSIDSDPLSNRFDLGNEPIEFAARRMKIAGELLPHVVDRTVEDGEGYQRARQAFGLLFSEYWRTAYFASRFPGGIHVHRDHKGDKDARPPFRIVEADQQRQAMKLLAETAFDTPRYEPEVLNHLAATRWSHWGVRDNFRLDYPIHDYVGMMQGRILAQLTNSMTLSRLHDSELKVAADADAYTLAEHLRTLVDAVFTEWKSPGEAKEHTNRDPYVSSFRRNLQRMALNRLADLVTVDTGAPDDARTLARMHLRDLDRSLGRLLEDDKREFDDYSRAHLLDAQERIRQVLEAKLELRSIN
ncbi:MAG: zinc-dependent metalloprotease [Planctomycetaceae bacterium]